MRQDWARPAPRPAAGTWQVLHSDWLNEQTSPGGGLAFGRNEKEGEDRAVLGRLAGRKLRESLPDFSNLLCEEEGEPLAQSGSLGQDLGCEKGWKFGKSRQVSFSSPFKISELANTSLAP